MMLLFQVFLSVVIIFEFRMMRWEIFTKFSHIQNKILKIEKSTSPKSESATTYVFSLLAFSFFEVFGLGFGFSSSSLSENVLYLILVLFSCLRLELEVFVLNILIQLANSISIFFLFFFNNLHEEWRKYQLRVKLKTLTPSALDVCDVSV